MTGGEFFFLELNGRIQVEHPVTEAVTGLDIVELQLRVAAGEGIEGVSARSTATLSRRGSTRRIRAASCRRPGGSSGSSCPPRVRVDAGVEQGDEVGTRYDPLLAKLVAHGPTRAAALDRLAAALAETQVEGVTTNLPFLRWLVAHPAFRDGTPTTAFLTEHPPLSPLPLRLPVGPWAAPFRLNLPSPPPRRPDGRARAGGADRLWRDAAPRRADARHRPARPRGGRGRGTGTTAARGARGDEDGDARLGAVCGPRERGARRGGRERRRGTLLVELDG